MKFKKALALLMAAAMALACMPAFGQDAEVQDKTLGSGDLVLDTDAAGGYEGDYVVIYNPSTSSSSSYSTGNMSGLIETEVDQDTKSASCDNADEPMIVDVDGELADCERKALGDEYGRIEHEGGMRASYTVGSTRSFTISYYSPGPSTITFKVLAVGEHCYIWTPATNEANYYTLDSINEDYAAQAAAEFDRMYSLMNSSFGDHDNGSNGDGRVSLLFYNIDDGFDPNTSSGYVAGYFSSYCYYTEGMPIINIDTWPGVYYVSPSGYERIGMTRAYGVACHEYQHCINYSNTSGMATWLNECFSAAAEEICYPGSSIVSRIQSWENYFYSDNDDWLYPPSEFEYQSDFVMHNGASMYYWNQDIDDVLALYAQVSMFAQYLYTQFGNSIYRSISNAYSSSEVSAISSATGMDCSELVKNFRIATYANDPTAYDGTYGFIPQTDYDPASYHDVEDPYNLLGPVVFTGSSCNISGGGAICVKPVGGVYNPPSGANSSLVYIGISRNIYTEPVELNGISIDPDDVSMLLQQTVSLSLMRDPANANNFDVVWTSSDPSVATVVGGKRSAAVSSVSKGNTVITATATDLDTGAVYTASAHIHVVNGYTYTRYEPTNEIVTGEEYLIGYTNENDVFLMMNYNPNPFTSTSESNYYYSYSNVYYAYGIKGVRDEEGNVIGLDNSAYADAQFINAEWIFSLSNGYYLIESGYNSGYYLRIYFTSQYNDLYAGYGTNQATNWLWNAQTNELSYYYSSSLTKYVTYMPSVGGHANFFCASPASTTPVQLYRKTTGTVMLDETYTVSFVDFDGYVFSTQDVEYGGSAVPPPDPTRVGYTFTGWDKSWENITEDTVITATYSINSYPLVIYYVFEDGADAAPAYNAYIDYDCEYYVPSPEVPGYEPSVAVVEGVMNACGAVYTVTYTPVSNTMLGDVDCNGLVNFTDISVLYAFLLGNAQVSEQGMLNADMNQDGSVSFTDVSALYNYLIGQ